ncbi:MAG: ABC transporter ATP-binding protein [Gemmatimonadetes bacterium]|nr:ABC transporter ATP-binding protein [Gemmatimonadota bacterium]
MRRFRRLLQFARRYRGLLAASFGAAVVASTLDGFSFALLIPFLRSLFGLDPAAASPTGIERILDAVLGWIFGPASGSTALPKVGLLILLTVVLKNVAAYVSTYLGIRIQEGVARDLREAFYAHLQRLGLAFYHHTKGGQLITRFLSDPEQAKLIVSQALIVALQNGTVILVYLAIMLSLSWRMALIVLTLAPVVVLLLRPILSAIRVRYRTLLEERGEMTAIVSETVEGARLVKAHGAEAYERRRFETRLGAYRDQYIGSQRIALLSHPLSETFGTIVIVLLLVIGSRGAWGMRPELFIAFLAVSLRLLSPVKSMSQFPAIAESSLAAAERLFEVLDLPPEDIDPADAPSFPGLRQAITFDHVWVAYQPDAWVLRGVHLQVPQGEIVAIVGPSGAGKSTLVDLLPRFIEPQRGAVLIDGVPITGYSRRSLRRAMGIVSQQTVIFNGTVRSNIAYGDEANASDAAVESAARAANAHRFIEQLPQGYDTMLGERGARLSGGERQRIAIARAILRDPPILILDEATSALDSESERLVQEAIQRLVEHRTVLVIAHRLSTVARADRIVVLDGGRVVEAGRHAELVAAGGLYQRLHALELSDIGG